MKSSRKTLPRPYRQLLLGTLLLALAIPLGYTFSHTDKANISADSATTPRVVATLAPLHSLTAGVMQGVGEPTLLLTTEAALHHYTMKPREAQRVTNADVLITISIEHEYYLKPLLNVSNGKQKLVLQAAEAEGITLLDDAPHHDHAEEGSKSNFDSHLWLDPQNAIAITRQIAEALAARDADHADIYRSNAERQISALEDLDAEIRKTFAPWDGKAIAAYASYHPTLRYFEHRYGIASGQNVTAHPEGGATPAEAEALHAAFAAHEFRCILLESESANRLLEQAAVRYPNIKRLGIDPLGNRFAPSPEQYGQLLRHVTETLSQCLR